jgi:uncharacterized membrane protein
VKAKLERSDTVALALIGATIGLTAAVYPRLPAQIATHFDVNGVANGWMSRSVGAWILPLTALGLWVLLRPGALLLPRAWQLRMSESPTGLVTALLAGFLGGLHGVMLYAALDPLASVGIALGSLIGAFWVALGLVLPRVRRNPWIGVRTAWTLSSDENWARTHRFAGFAFCCGGVLAFFATLAGQGTLSTAFILSSATVPAVYSFVLARRLPPEA